MKKMFTKKTFAISFVLAFLFIGMAFVVMVRSWKEYKNDEFGFSFRYPSNWYISGYFDSKDQNGDRHMGFYVDPKGELPVPMSPIRSPGGVEVYVDGGKTIIETHMLQKDFSKLEKRKLNNKTGIIDEHIGRTPEGLYVFVKDLYVVGNRYEYYINTLTYSKESSYASQIIARPYHIIGSLIIDSFNFY